MKLARKFLKFNTESKEKFWIKCTIFFLLVFMCLNLLINDQRRLSKKIKLKYNYNFSNEAHESSRSPTRVHNDYFTEDTEEWFQIKSQFEKIKYLNQSLCKEVPDSIQTRINISEIPLNFSAMSNDIDKYNFSLSLQPGGKWTPLTCRARHKVAIVIPYKDRLENLNYFMYHMHPFLQRQELEYQIFVVEQANDALFNKGVLMNGAFKEILNIYNYSNNTLEHFPFDCIIFHDVDLLPEDDRILYSCPLMRPRHLSAAIDKYKYKIFYTKLIGGVLNFKIYHFVKANGYSNEYWGWGGEDDDMEVRLTKQKIGYERPNVKIAHYKMLKHEKRVKNPKRGQLLKIATKRLQKDGLNNVKYKLIDIVKYRMFTHILIDVGAPPADLIEAIRKEEIKEKEKAKKQKVNSKNRTIATKIIHRKSTTAQRSYSNLSNLAENND